MTDFAHPPVTPTRSTSSTSSTGRSISSAPHTPNPDYALNDRYTKDTGRVFLSGVQALARIPLEQLRVDRLYGLNTAAFVSGYPGSPLAGFDNPFPAAPADPAPF